MRKRLNILQRIDQVRQKVSYLKKEKSVETYKAVTHDQVTAEVRQHLIDTGIVIVPSLVAGETKDSGAKTAKGNPIVRYEAIFDVHFIAIDDRTDLVTVRVPAHANDHGDKAPGKALSYAVKSAILKIFNIETGENDEGRIINEDIDGKELADWYERITEAADEAALRAVLNDACARAREAHDHGAKARFIERGEKRAQVLGIQLVKKDAPRVEPPKAKEPPSEPSAEPPAEKVAAQKQAPANGDKASPGLIKSLRNVAKQKGLNDGQLLAKAEKLGFGLVKSVDDFTKDAGGAVLRDVSEYASA